MLFWRASGPKPVEKEIRDRFFRLLGVPVPPGQGDYFVRFLYHIQRNGDLSDSQLDKLAEQLLIAGRRPWSRDQFPEIASWLVANEKPLAIVTEGAKRQEFFSPLVSSGEPPFMSASLPGVQGHRSYVNALNARAMLRLKGGDAKGAWRDILTCHRIARLGSHGPTLVQYMVGIALDGITGEADLAFIEYAHLNAKQSMSRLRDIQSLPAFPDLAERFNTSSRFLFLDATIATARGKRKWLMEIWPPNDVVDFLGPLEMTVGVDWNAALRVGNQQCDNIVSALGKPNWRESDKATREIVERWLETAKKGKLDPQTLKAAKNGQQVAGEAVGRLLFLSIFPAVGAANQHRYRTMQSSANLRIAFALACYRAKHNRYPVRLEELSPAFLKRIPKDVFTGEELRYRRQADGYLLYSVGINGKDDGGRTATKRLGDTSDDLRVLMPLPAE